MENYWMSHYVGMASFDVYHLKVDTVIRQRWKIIGCPTTLVRPVLMYIIGQCKHLAGPDDRLYSVLC